MGWLDGALKRVGRLAWHAGPSTIMTIGGLGKDLISAPFIDDDVDGFTHTLTEIGLRRTADEMGNLLGPQGAAGTAVGALPAGFRNPARSVIHPALDFLDAAYREGVGEPISTMMTAASMSSASAGSSMWDEWNPANYGKQLGVFMNPHTWNEAYKLAQHRSPGQAVALAMQTHDILNEAEVKAAQNTDAYRYISGVTDGVIRWYLDPTVVGIEGGKIARYATDLGHVNPAFKSVETIGDQRLWADMTEQRARNFEKLAADHEQLGWAGGRNADNMVAAKKFKNLAAHLRHDLASAGFGGESGIAYQVGKTAADTRRAEAIDIAVEGWEGRVSEFVASQTYNDLTDAEKIAAKKGMARDLNRALGVGSVLYSQEALDAMNFDDIKNIAQGLDMSFTVEGQRLIEDVLGNDAVPEAMQRLELERYINDSQPWVNGLLDEGKFSEEQLLYMSPTQFLRTVEWGQGLKMTETGLPFKSYTFEAADRGFYWPGQDGLGGGARYPADLHSELRDAPEAMGYQAHVNPHWSQIAEMTGDPGAATDMGFVWRESMLGESQKINVHEGTGSASIAFNQGDTLPVGEGSQPLDSAISFGPAHQPPQRVVAPTDRLGMTNDTYTSRNGISDLAGRRTEPVVPISTPEFADRVVETTGRMKRIYQEMGPVPTDPIEFERYAADFGDKMFDTLWEKEKFKKIVNDELNGVMNPNWDPETRATLDSFSQVFDALVGQEGQGGFAEDAGMLFRPGHDAGEDLLAEILTYMSEPTAFRQFKGRYSGQMVGGEGKWFPRITHSEFIDKNFDVHVTPITPGRVKDSMAKLTVPFHPTDDFENTIKIADPHWAELHGDLPLVDPPLIRLYDPNRARIPIKSQTSIDKFFNSSMRYMGLQSRGWNKVNTWIQGQLFPKYALDGADIPQLYKSVNVDGTIPRRAQQAESTLTDSQIRARMARMERLKSGEFLQSAIPTPSELPSPQRISDMSLVQASWTMPDELYHVSLDRAGDELRGYVQAELPHNALIERPIISDPNIVNRAHKPQIRLTSSSSQAHANEAWAKEASRLLEITNRDPAMLPQAFAQHLYKEYANDIYLMQERGEIGPDRVNELLELADDWLAGASTEGSYAMRMGKLLDQYGGLWSTAHGYAGRKLMSFSGRSNMWLMDHLRAENVTLHKFVAEDLLQTGAGIGNPQQLDQFNHYGDLALTGRRPTPSGETAGFAFNEQGYEDVASMIRYDAEQNVNDMTFNDAFEILKDPEGPVGASGIQAEDYYLGLRNDAKKAILDRMIDEEVDIYKLTHDGKGPRNVDLWRLNKRKDIMDSGRLDEITISEAYDVLEGSGDRDLLDELWHHASVAEERRLRADPDVVMGREYQNIMFNRNYRPYGDNGRPPISDADRNRVAAQIRNRLFPNHEQGDAISYALAHAETPQERTLAMRVMMGDLNALTDYGFIKNSILGEILRNQFRNLSANASDAERARNEFPTAAQTLGVLYDGRGRELNGLIDQTINEIRARDNVEAAFASVRKPPELTLRSGARVAITHSDLYQQSTFTKPIRVFSQMSNHRIVDLAGIDADIQFDRWLRDSDSSWFGHEVPYITPEERDVLRGRFMGASPEQRFSIAQEVEDTIVRRMAEKNGMDLSNADDAQQFSEIRRWARAQHQQVTHLTNRRQYDGDEVNTFVKKNADMSGMDLLRIEGDDAVTILPIWARTQTAQFYAFPDLAALDQAFGKVAEWRRRFPGVDAAYRVPKQLLQNVMSVWRVATLLRPGWTARVLFDEQLRIMAKVGVMAEFSGLRQGMRGLTPYMLERLKVTSRQMDLMAERTLMRDIEGMQEPAVIAGGQVSYYEQATDYFQRMSDRLANTQEQAARQSQEVQDLARIARDSGSKQDRIRWMEARDRKARFPARIKEAEGRMETARARMEAAEREQASRPVEQTAADMTDVAPAPLTAPVARPMAIGGVAGAAVGGVVAGPLGAAAGASLGAGLLSALARVEDKGYPSLSVLDEIVNPAFGPPGDIANRYLNLVSSQRDFFEFMGKNEQKFYNSMNINPHSWRTYIGTDPEYVSMWAQAVNHTIANDPMGRKILEGANPDEIANWLRYEKEGVEYGQAIPGRRGQEQQWAQAAYNQVHRYTLGFKEDLVEAALNHNAGKRHLEGWLPSQLPAVHGPELEQILGKNGVTSHFNKWVDHWFHNLGTAPTDYLSRQPYFAHVYEAEIRRTMTIFEGKKVPEKTMLGLEESARKFALKETRDLLYDLSERSQFAEAARMFIPFFGAWQEVIQTWARLAVENPRFAIHMGMAYGAPDKAGWVQKDPDSGEEYVVLRLPEPLKDLVNHGPLKGAFDNQSSIRFAKGSVSMLASGLPGFGPLVNLAVSQVVKNRPELIDSVKYLVPFGVSESWVDPFLPAGFRRIQSLVKGEDDAAYSVLYTKILLSHLTQISQGTDPDFTIEAINQDPEIREKLFDQVTSETQHLSALRWVASFVSPVSFSYNSLYQKQIDEYRAMRKANPTSADDEFLKKYGAEFFYLTQAVTKTNNGVPPTLQGAEAYEHFGPIIDKYPEYGSLVVGDSDAGEASKFMSAVYNRQMQTPVEPGSNVMQRERLSHLEIVEAPQVRQGWQELSRYLDQVDAAMIAIGAKTYADAPMLRDYKNYVIQQLALKYPAWAKEYFVQDELKWEKRIEAFREISQTPGLSDRPDMEGLHTYIQARDQVLQVLQNRKAQGGSASIFADRNQDIYDQWFAYRLSLREGNLAFEQLYNRYLDRDPMTVYPISMEAL